MRASTSLPRVSAQDGFQDHDVVNIFYNGILTRCGENIYALCRFNENDDEVKAGALRQVYQGRLLYVNQPEVFYEGWGKLGSGKSRKFNYGDKISVKKASQDEWGKLVAKPQDTTAFNQDYSMIVKCGDDESYPCFRLGKNYKSKVADNLVFGLLKDKLYVLLAIDMKKGLFRTHGGHVEGKETGAQGAEREFEEETSFKINPENVIAKFEIERRLAPEIQESRRGYVVDLPGDYIDDGIYEPRENMYDNEYVKFNKGVYKDQTMTNLLTSYYQIHGNQLLKTYKDDGATSKMITTVNVNLCKITENDLKRMGTSNDPSEELYTMFVDVDGLTFIRKNRLFQWDMHSALVEEGLSFCRKYTRINEKSQNEICEKLVKNIQDWKSEMIKMIPEGSELDKSKKNNNSRDDNSNKPKLLSSDGKNLLKQKLTQTTFELNNTINKMINSSM